MRLAYLPGGRGGRALALALAAAALAASSFPCAARAQEAAVAEAVTILDGSGVWRVLHSWNAPMVNTSEGLRERRIESHRASATDQPDFRFMTLYPARDWTAVDFDDSTWPRRHFFVKYANGEWDHRAGGGSASPYLRQLCLRGRFTVTDPSAVKGLRLTMGYRGGTIVYVNGKELTRAHLPAGEVAAGSLAEIYPTSAYLKEDGKPWSWWNDRDVVAQQCYPHRVRWLRDVAVPASMLRKGLNVLAVEIHAAPYPEVFAKAGPEWATCGLVELHLQAGGAGGVVPNVVRPKGLQVWNTSTAEQVFDVDWADPHEPLRPMRMSGPRNGCASGRVVAGCDEPLRNFRAALSELTAPSGPKLPPEAAKVWFGRFDVVRGARWGGGWDGRHVQWGQLELRRDDALVASPPAEVAIAAKQMPHGVPEARRADGLPAGLVDGALQPVWVTVDIPADAAAGQYRAVLTISCQGHADVQVPVELTVIDWKLHDPESYVYWMGMVESPEAVALTYDVPAWSEKHWALVARSLEWIGKLGPKVLLIPLGAESQYGNAESMVLWKDAGEGKFTHDFSRVEGYVDLALKHMGRPKCVVVGVWDSCMHVSVPKPLKRDFPRYSVLGPDGKVTNADGPPHGSDEALAFWKPVLTGVREVLAKRGLEQAMLLGYLADRLPDKETVEVFRKILPDVGWQSTRHGERGCEYLPAAEANVPVKYHTNVWGGWVNHDPDTRRPYGWRNPINPSLRTWLDRGLFDASSIAQYRTACEQALLADRHGLGQIGADFWPVKDADGKPTHTMVGRFPATNEGNLGIYAGQLLYAGPDGPVPTARYQMMRENIQECEARIFLEKLLTANPCPLAPELASKYQGLLDERTRWHRAQGVAEEAYLSWPYSGWEVRRAALFDAAAEAAKAVAKP